MINNHFVISHRDNVWQFSFRGNVTGPFNSKDQAVSAAIDAAGRIEDADVEVVIYDVAQKPETIWRTGQAKPTGG